MASEKETTIRSVYSAIMEITEKRGLQAEADRMEAASRREAARKEEEHNKAQAEENKPVAVMVAPSPSEDLQLPLLLPAVNTPPKTIEAPKENNFSKGFLVFNLSLTVFLLMISLRFPESWVNAVAAKLNAMIVYGSFFIFSIAKLPSAVKGSFLDLHYYQISLHGDLVAFYSLELLILFAVLFSLVQNTTWIKKAVIFFSLIPLVILANILRVLWACGLALNYGALSADRYFHGLLVDFAFVFVVLGLIFFEFLSFTD